MDRFATTPAMRASGSSTYKARGALMQPFLEANAGRFGFRYGIQETAEVASHLDAQGAAYAALLLSGAENDLFHTLRVDKRRIEWLAGRMAAKAAFAQYHRGAFRGHRQGAEPGSPAQERLPGVHRHQGERVQRARPAVHGDHLRCGCPLSVLRRFRQRRYVRVERGRPGPVTDGTAGGVEHEITRTSTPRPPKSPRRGRPAGV